jgi:hypothetical protein
MGDSNQLSVISVQEPCGYLRSEKAKPRNTQPRICVASPYRRSSWLCREILLFSFLTVFQQIALDLTAGGFR